MRDLSSRLSAAADFVEQGSSVCDVGTDHGYLPAFLYLSGKCKSVTATDIREKPLKNAQKNFEKFGVQGVKLILCDGLDGVDRQIADTVIITGMGGDVISGIIDRAEFLRDETVSLILQPMTASVTLRKYLAQNGFLTDSEKAVKENGKIYSVIKAHYCGKPYKLSDVQTLIGWLDISDAASHAYIQKQYKIISKCAADIENVEQMRAEFEKYNLISSQLKNILEGKNGI